MVHAAPYVDRPAPLNGQACCSDGAAHVPLHGVDLGNNSHSETKGRKGQSGGQ